MGKSGAVLIVTMLFMAVTSAGSAELVAVSSLFTYDIYRTYINPKATGKQVNKPYLPSVACHLVKSPNRLMLILNKQRASAHVVWPVAPFKFSSEVKWSMASHYILP
jgi:hypothetical protein